MLFSYVILCDFFPLYEFQSDECVSNAETNTDIEISTARVSNRSWTMTNSNRTAPYGRYRHSRPGTTEIILVVWVFTLFFDEIRQVMNIPSLILSLCNKCAIFYCLA